jgi:hypothetical protein
VRRHRSDLSNHRDDLGRVAAELLKTLEYRGYDSTGAPFPGRHARSRSARQGRRRAVGDGARAGHRRPCGPRLLRAGALGHVRRGDRPPTRSPTWCAARRSRCTAPTTATSPTATTSRPGSPPRATRVLSDNDGEMVVHTVEHFFALASSRPARRQRARHAPAAACARPSCAPGREARGQLRRGGSSTRSRACCGPSSRARACTSGWARRRGRALRHRVVDLSSCSSSRACSCPCAEGEFVEYDRRLPALRHASRTAWPTARPEPIDARARAQPPARQGHRARARRSPPSWSRRSARRSSHGAHVITMFGGQRAALRPLRPRPPTPAIAELPAASTRCRLLYDDERMREPSHAAVRLAPRSAPRSQERRRARARAPPRARTDATAHLVGGAASSWTSCPWRAARRRARGAPARRCSRPRRRTSSPSAVERFCDHVPGDAIARRGRIYVVCCGSSFHAAKAAALFFNELAGVELTPILPGSSAGSAPQSLRDGDLVVAVSQSGETKDLIDVLNDVMATRPRRRRVGAGQQRQLHPRPGEERRGHPAALRPRGGRARDQELHQPAHGLLLPGAEVAPRGADGPQSPTRARDMASASPRARRARVPARCSSARPRQHRGRRRGGRQLLYLRPSLHILATRITAVAKEGALKIREVVLNHTEGFEASEFKHGPNTILGFNTVLGVDQVDALLKPSARCKTLAARASRPGSTPPRPGSCSPRRRDSVLPEPAQFTVRVRACGLRRAVGREALLARSTQDYPLVYVTGPDARDVNLTVSADQHPQDPRGEHRGHRRGAPRPARRGDQAPRRQPPLRRGVHRAARAPTTR